MQLMVEDQELEMAKTTMAKGFMLETTPTNPKLGAELIDTDTFKKAPKANIE